MCFLLLRIDLLLHTVLMNRVGFTINNKRCGEHHLNDHKYNLNNLNQVDCIIFLKGGVTF